VFNDVSVDFRCMLRLFFYTPETGLRCSTDTVWWHEVSPTNLHKEQTYFFTLIAFMKYVQNETSHRIAFIVEGTMLHEFDQELRQEAPSGVQAMLVLCRSRMFDTRFNRAYTCL
jgi:hypothetical protein